MKKLDVQDAKETLSTILKCQKEVGIQDYCFISFGTLLGAFRPTLREGEYVQGFMEHDDDMDMSVLSERITVEQQNEYTHKLKEAGLFDAREKYQFRDNGRLLWCSLRRKPAPIGAKCCHWFWQKWKGYYWHSKGVDWSQTNKFPMRDYPREKNCQAVMLGVPEDWISELIQIDFEGMRVNIPILSGHCLDLWYQNWHTPKVGGSSGKKIVATVRNWKDEDSWNIIKA